jgi:hypothetical protein
MKFLAEAEKMVVVGGSIITIRAGTFETTDTATCDALMNVRGVKQVKTVKKQKKAN